MRGQTPVYGIRFPPRGLRLRSRGAGLGWLWVVAAAFLIVSAGRMQAPQQASLVTGCFYWTAYRYGILWRVPGGTGGSSPGVVVVLVVNNQPCVKNLTLLYFFIKSIALTLVRKKTPIKWGIYACRVTRYLLHSGRGGGKVGLCKPFHSIRRSKKWKNSCCVCRAYVAYR